MYARMGNVKAGRLEDPETGESLSDVETTLKGVGITLRESNSEFRNFGDVLAEVAEKWNTYSSVQKRAIARAFGNTRQQEKFLVLMENYDKALQYTTVAAESAGTAQEKYTQAYLNSLEAAKNEFTAVWQTFSANIADEEWFAQLIKIGTDFIGLLNGIVEIWNTVDNAAQHIPSTILRIAATAGVLYAALHLFAKIPSVFKGIAVSLSDIATKLHLVSSETQNARIATEQYRVAVQQLSAEERALYVGGSSGGTRATEVAAGGKAGIVAIIATVAISAIMWIKAAAEEAKEAKRQALQDDVEESRTKVANLKSEISELEGLRSELQKAYTDMSALESIYDKLHGKIAVSQQLLNGEATAISGATDALNREIEAKKLALAFEDEQARSKTILKADSDNRYQDYRAVDGQLGVGSAIMTAWNFLTSGKTYADLFTDWDSLYEDFVRAKNKALYGAEDPSQLKKDLVESLYNDYVSAFQKEIDEFSVAGGSETAKELLHDLVEDGKKSAAILEALKAVSTSATVQPLYDAYLDAVANNPNKAYSALEALRKEITRLSGLSFSFWGDWVQYTADAESSTSRLVLKVRSFNDLVSSIKDPFSALIKAENEMSERGKLSSDSLVSLEKYNLLDYVEKTADGYVLIANAAQTYRTEVANTAQEELQNRVNAAKTLVGWNEQIAQSYGDSAEGVLKYLKAQQELARVQFANNLTWQQDPYASNLYKIYNSTNPALAESWAQAVIDQLWGKSGERQKYDDAIANLSNALENSARTDAVLDSLTGSSVADAAASAWTKALDTQKHALEMGKITEQEYYNWVINNYKAFLGNYADTLDERRSVEEDYFKWLKGLYKDDLDAQKDELNQKKDELKDYYDSRKKMIEDAYDEKEEEDKRAEYQKDITKLQDLIEMLKRDTSQAARRKQAEAEEKLAESMKDYEAWERENAKDRLLESIDAEYDAAVKSIDEQVEQIDGKMGSLDSNTQGIYSIIAQWATARGYTVPAAAMGTANSRGGAYITQERGAELLGMNLNGGFTYLTPGSKVWTATATEFLYKFANAPAAYLARFMRGIGSGVPEVQANSVTMGDIVINGRADADTVAALRKERENLAYEVLEQFKKLRKA